MSSEMSQTQVRIYLNTFKFIFSLFLFGINLCRDRLSNNLHLLLIAIVDGLDDTYVTIQKSDRIPKQQLTEGAFAKVDTPKGTVFSLYSGRVLSQKEMDLYIKLSDEQIQQVKDENSNNIDVAADFAESLWMNRYDSYILKHKKSKIV